MLRKILLVLVLVSLTVAFGCKKEEPQPVAPATSDIQKQTDEAAKEAATAAEAAKKDAGKQLENAGKELQK